MSLNLSELIKVAISVSPTLAPLAGFGELLFLTNDVNDLKWLSAAERTRKFKSLEEVQVASALNPTSEVVKAATAFYSQVPQPIDFTVGIMASSDYAGALLGGLHGKLEDIKGITIGNFNISVDGGEAKSVTNLDLSTSTSFEDVAGKIQTAIQAIVVDKDETKDFTAVTCEYTNFSFQITSGTVGVASSVAPLTGTAEVDQDFIKLLGLDAALANQVDGGSAETVSSALGKVADISSSFIGVVLHKSLRDLEASISGVTGAAAWCQASNKIFLNTTNDSQIFGANQLDTEAGKLYSKAFSKTITSFGKDSFEYPSASLFGRISTVNYEGTNTTITLTFKKMPSITALNLTGSQKAKMDAINVGGFMDFAGNLMYASSRMADGGWLDAVHGLMWLEDRIQKGVFNLMYGTTTKIPYTDTGINMVVQKVTVALEQAVANGLIAAGMTPEGEFLPEGYVIYAKSVTEVAAEDKSNRLYRGITFKCVGAGALQGVVISGSFNE